MNIPSFWASYTLTLNYKNKSTKIKRYGWSDDSVVVAEAHAIERCQQAQQTLLTTGNVKRIEGKKTYLDESGLPIREEIVARYAALNCVTTINSYGATCLNTENVMILDIDNDDLELAYPKKTHIKPPKKLSVTLGFLPILIIIVTLALTGFYPQSIGFGLLTIITSLGLFLWIALFISKLNDKKYSQWHYNQGGYIGMLDAFINPLLATYPTKAFNVYQTPLGMRLIALDTTYQANDERTLECYDALPVDPLYAKLCKVQDCFRARVTAKPWNMGMDERLPTTIFWENQDVSLQRRSEWLIDYNELAKTYAACHFVKQVGERRLPAPDSNEVKTLRYIDEVIGLHDELCRSHSDLPLA